MPDAKEPKGFKVVDRRGQDREEKPAAAPEVDGPGWKMRHGRDDVASLPADFTTFCLSLASATLIHLGAAPVPETERTQVDLPLAKQTIDVLGMLAEKTKGNLTDAESKLLSTVLYDLRMRYVHVATGAPAGEPSQTPGQA